MTTAKRSISFIDSFYRALDNGTTTSGPVCEIEQGLENSEYPAVSLSPRSRSTTMDLNALNRLYRETSAQVRTNGSDEDRKKALLSHFFVEASKETRQSIEQHKRFSQPSLVRTETEGEQEMKDENDTAPITSESSVDNHEMNLML